MTGTAIKGNLHDLGSDGLGFIIPENQPDTSYAFLLDGVQNVKASSFKAAGLREGDAVEFHLNAKRQVDRISRV